MERGVDTGVAGQTDIWMGVGMGWINTKVFGELNKSKDRRIYEEIGGIWRDRRMY